MYDLKERGQKIVLKITKGVVYFEKEKLESIHLALLLFVHRQDC